MRAFISLILLISVVASGRAHLGGERERIIAYWREQLPATPIPESLWELISAHDDDGRGVPSIRLVQEVDQSSLTDRGAGQEGLFRYHSYAAEGEDEGLLIYDHYATDERKGKPSSASLFLLERNLARGTKVSVNFSRKRKAHFLPRSAAEEIPFSSDKLSLALNQLNVAPRSPAANAMNRTLRTCERPAMEGETKHCATSLESMIDFTTSNLGSNRLSVLMTSVPKTSKSVKQEYAVLGVKFESEADKPAVVCHLLKYEYAVYYCHVLEGTKVARVWMEGEDGSTVEAVSLCHTDTSAWSPEHVALQTFNLKPGGASVCHFIPQNHLAWFAAN